MSEPHDPLEAELSALRPHEASSGLRRRIAESLADSPRARLWRLGWIALAGGLAAACVAVALLWWSGGRGVEPPPIVIRPEPVPPVAVEDSEPTLLDYQRALARSPEELEALLNQYVMVAPGTHPELVRIGAFTRSDAQLHALLGED